eukprot:EC785808.1.p1 GENE.EC785808.1~~EC785808.1.p1  ORF type:complete len:71 (-),score=5.63 EC785808.1:14-226(-)
MAVAIAQRTHSQDDHRQSPSHSKKPSSQKRHTRASSLTDSVALETNHKVLELTAVIKTAQTTPHSQTRAA